MPKYPHCYNCGHSLWFHHNLLWCSKCDCGGWTEEP